MDPTVMDSKTMDKIIGDPEVIYKDGDLSLIVRDRCFVVSSHALAFVSTVFKQMLLGEFTESRPISGAPWIVKLPEDNPVPFQSILQMIHHRFYEQPALAAIDRISQLYDITVITDKYTMSHLLIPYAKGWVAEIQRIKTVSDPRWKSTLAKIMFIAWELGSEQLFKSSYRALVVNCEGDEWAEFQKENAKLDQEAQIASFWTTERMALVFGDPTVIVPPEVPRTCRGDAPATASPTNCTRPGCLGQESHLSECHRHASRRCCWPDSRE